ncbi:hypothetical protein DSM100688_0411 [Bifidobacterium ramosum]|uniref:Uncharacterized protein n=1 Tax=Bifidobacterium ramosum TaxID=1798158 RepID=A0A6L4X2V3_9BIFI|nr:hypothetical protein [Bifidobacterium ramosum]KAB8289331.1 hypothetical protein DSM100688_0411 [Bifidobacterium ramosum]
MTTRREAWTRPFVLFCRDPGFRRALRRLDPELYRRFVEEAKRQ